MEKESRYQVIISEQATQMLISHAYFIAQVSEKAAERIVTLFEEKANSLETMPHTCPWFFGDYIPKMSTVIY